MSEFPESSTQKINEGAVNKRLKLSELTQKADRLSDLPDCLIQHILSFLPETRDTICTGVLSKRWRNQWRQVPVLSFHHLWHNVIQIIDQVLNQFECSKLERFRISVIPNQVVIDPCIDHKIRFAISRDVKELILEYFNVYYNKVRLPEFLFSHTWLVKLQLHGCVLPVHSERVNWKYLKELNASNCHFPDQDIENILSRSLLLESLNLEDCFVRVLAIASKSLRKLVLGRCFDKLILSCPNMEGLQLRFRRSYPFSVVDCNKKTSCGPVRLTENGEFFVTSESLKKLVLGNLYIHYVEISCPNLEELELLEKMRSMTVKAVNVQS